jgi:hypothetical protein
MGKGIFFTLRPEAPALATRKMPIAVPALNGEGNTQTASARQILGTLAAYCTRIKGQKP